MADVIGSAVITVGADASNFGKDLAGQADPQAKKAGEQVGTTAGQAAGKKTTSLMGSVLKAGLVGVGLAAGAVLTKAIVGGFQRLSAIDAAKKKLEGLGNSGKQVEAIMANALAAVKGTAFGLDEAATISANLVAAGIKPGNALEKALKAVANTASVAGTSMADVSQIFTEVAATGKVTGDTLMRLESRGIPATALLAKSLGKTREEIRQLTREGKIDFETFTGVIESTMGKAAGIAGQSFVGMLKNVGASLNRFGAVLIGPVFEGVKVLFPAIMTAVDNATEAIKPFVNVINSYLKPAFEWLAGFIERIDLTKIFDGTEDIEGKVTGVADTLFGLADKVQAAVLDMLEKAPHYIEKYMPMFAEALVSKVNFLLAAIQQILTGIVGAIVAGMPAIIIAFSTALPGFIDAIVKIVPQLVGAVVSLVQTVVQAIPALLPLVLDAAFMLFSGLVDAVLTLGPILVQQVLNLVMTLVTMLPTLASQLANSASVLFDGLVQGLLTAIPLLLNAIMTALPLIFQAIVAAVPQLLSAALTLFTSLIDGLLLALPLVVDAVLGLLPQLAQALLSMVPMLIQSALMLFETLLTALLDILPVVIQTAISLVPQVIEALIGLVPKLVDAAITLFMGLVEGLSNALPILLTALTGLLPKLAQTILGMLPLLIQTAITLFTSLVQGLVTVIPILIQTIVGLIPMLIQLLVEYVPVLIQGAINLFLALVQALGTVVPLVINAVLGMLPMLIEALIGMIPVLIEGAIELFLSIVEALPVIIPQLITALMDLLTVFMFAVVDAIPLLLDAALMLFMAIVDALPDIIPPLVIAIVKLIPAIVKAIISIGPALFEAGKKMFGKLRESLPEVWARMKVSLAEFGPKMVAVLKTLLPRLKQAGKDLIQGLINGIKDMGGAALNAVKDIGNNMLDSVKGIFGISSPSKVFKGYGHNIIRGLVQGLEGSADQAYRSITRIVARIKDAPGLSNAKESVLVEWVNKQGAALLKAVKAQDVALDKYKAANEVLKDLQTDRAGLLANVSSGLAGEFNTGDYVKTKGPGGPATASFAAIASGLSGMVSKMKAFAGKLKELAAAGFPTALIQEIAGLGSVQGAAVADAMLGATGEQKSAFLADYSALTSWSNAAGDAVAGSMYDVGIAAQAGLVKGLQDDYTDLKAASKTLTDKITKYVKDNLGIKSPSRVFKSIGEYMGKGLVDGLKSMEAPVTGALKSLVTVPDVGLNASRAPGAVSRRNATLLAPSVGGGDTYQVNVTVDMSDLAQLRDLEEFLKMVRVKARMGVKSGKVG